MLIGCGVSVGENYVSNNIEKLQVGVTTIQNAHNLFGKPFTSESVVTSDLNSTILGYSYRKGPGMGNRIDSKYIILEFKDSLLNGYYHNNSFTEESTDFPREMVTKLISHQSTRADVINLVGKKYGMIRLPSNLVARLPDEFSRTLSKEAKYVLGYQLLYYKSSSQGFIADVRTLMLSFDQNDILIDKYYYEGANK
jgi:hypothetical protein